MTDPGRAIFLGSGAFAVPILDRLAAEPAVDIAAVVTVPPRPTGRGGEVRSTPVAAAAGRLGLEVIAPERLRDDATIASIVALRPEVGILADFGRIVPQVILDVPRAGILNVHPSLLPRWRGASPIAGAILAGDRVTGVTVFRMDPGLDSGPIVAAMEAPLSPTDTAPDVEARLAIVGADLIARTIGPWLRGELAAQPQDESAATMTKRHRRGDGLLDPTQSAVALERRVRGFAPWPGTFIRTPSGPVAVRRASVVPIPTAATGAAPGTLVTSGREVVVVTADGGLRLDEVQPAGRRPMTGPEWLRGRPDLGAARD